MSNDHRYGVTADVFDVAVPSLGWYEVYFYQGDDLALAMARLTLAVADQSEHMLVRSVKFTNRRAQIHEVVCNAKTEPEPITEPIYCDACDCHETVWYKGGSTETGKCHPKCGCVPRPEPEEQEDASSSTPTLKEFDSESHDYSLSDCTYWDTPDNTNECSGPRVGLAAFSDTYTAIMCEGHANRRAGNPA